MDAEVREILSVILIINRWYRLITLLEEYIFKHRKMKKKVYEKPLAEIVVFNSDEVMQLPGASQIDNDGDGIPEQKGQGNDRIIPGDPDGGIGAKPSAPWENSSHSIWED